LLNCLPAARGHTDFPMVARCAVIAVAVAVLTACSTLESFIPRPPPTEAPFCAPFGDELGSMHLDYAVAPANQPDVSAAEAERVGRSMMGDQGVTCSVKLAKYDNLADHRPLVWVVHLDGLAIEALGGSLVTNGTQPPPRFLRRALVLVSTEAPPTPLTSHATTR
jgi:hypothetical protein